MSATLPSAYSPIATRMEDALAGLDFSPVRGGYQRGDLRLTISPQWCVLQSPGVESSSDAPRNDVGMPGLWKHVHADGATPRIFALPRRVWNAALSTDAEADTNVFEQCLRWALETAEATSLPHWEPPARALVDSWLAPDQLTVVAGALLRQGELIYAPDRLAIRFPLVPEMAEDLPPSRLTWLEALMGDAQNRWHLVRLGFDRDADDALSAVAEIDLTGVPPEIAEDLFVVSLEALRWVVQWLGETTDWLADATVASELLAVCPNTKP